MTFLDQWIGRVWQGDCMEFMRQLPDGCVDLALTDPPYGHNNNNGDLIANREAALGRGRPGEPRPIANDGPEANDVFRAALVQIARLLKPGACLCCCCCGGGPDPQFGRWSLWMDETPGLKFKQAVVWDKLGLGMGWHYRRNYEFMLVAEKPGAACKWYGGHDTPNVFRFPRVIPRADDHPTAKPVELIGHFMRLHSEPGDLVLDPFCGGGTVPVVAERRGRLWLASEIDPVWVAYSEQRIARERAQIKLPMEVA